MKPCIKTWGQEGQRGHPYSCNDILCPHSENSTGARGADLNRGKKFCPRCPRSKIKERHVQSLMGVAMPLLPPLPPHKKHNGKVFWRRGYGVA